MKLPEGQNIGSSMRNSWPRRISWWLDGDQGSVAKQFAVFISVGVATVILDVATLAAMMRLGVHYSLSTTIAFVASLIFNYFSHALITFKSGNSRQSAFRYGVIVLVNYAVTMLMVTASETWLGGVMIGKIASLPVLAAIGYITSRYWIFL